jgi:hypothetical protein
MQKAQSFLPGLFFALLLPQSFDTLNRPEFRGGQFV